jgi:hypothetical protein
MAMHSKISRPGYAIAALLCAVLAWSSPAAAQTVTTGGISGSIVDPQGGVLPGVTVTAVHEPTGTQYTGLTDAQGHFELPNVRVGGPYAVTATLSGFRDQTERNINVGLGEAKTVDFKLSLASVSETVTVTAEVPVIDVTRAGTASNIQRQTIENLPSIQRSVFDFARTSPFVNLTQDSAGGDQYISVAGRNNRYNNMQIDGAVNNDVFGLAANGAPGGQAGTQPISLDAVQEIQVVVSPYDVRQGGFSGGGVNMVTRSGANSFSGTGYWFQRSESLVGTIPGIATVATPSPADLQYGRFNDRQAGFSVGGPIAQNKAFFFSNFDFGRKTNPAGFSVSGNSGQPWGHQSDVQQIADIAKSVYGYDTGNLDEVSQPTDSDKYFVRADFNVARGHQLTARMNYIDATRLLSTAGIPSNQTYALPNDFYTFGDKNLGIVTQLNSTFGSTFNELRVGYQRVRDARENPTPIFPYVRVDLADSNSVRLGSENSSHANQLDQDIIELTDDLTFVRGSHTWTVGTHNEFFKFRNLFIQNLYGNYEFTSIDNFRQGFAQSYSVSYSNTTDPLLAATFSVRQFGGYIGDQWRARNNLTLTYGLRLDAPNFPDTPKANPLTVADFGYATDVVPSPLMWSPRIGFNWDLSKGGTQRSQVRGGFGFFTGRTPYVWLSNQYGNTGLDFTSISTNLSTANRIPFVADPLNQPRTVTGGTSGRQTVNMIDPDYKYPEVLRGNIAYDRSLGFLGLVGTGEFLYSSTVKDINYQNLNYVAAGKLPDGRTTYVKKDPNLNDAILLTNTDLGDSWTAAIKIERPFHRGYNFSGSYLYGQAHAVNDGTSSIAASSWANNPAQYSLDMPLTRSNYDPGHRVNLTAVIPIPLGAGLRSMASFFYNGLSGRPYVIMFNGDANLDNRTNNDIAFIPSSPDQVILLNGTWDQLDAYLRNDPASKDNRGTIPERNIGRAPWSNQLDFRYAVTIPTRSKATVELTMDVFNLMNLLNSNWGWQYYPYFPSASANGLLGYSGIDPATGKERINLATITNPNFLGTFTRDDTRSRWQAQWGARVRF